MGLENKQAIVVARDAHFFISSFHSVVGMLQRISEFIGILATLSTLIRLQLIHFEQTSEVAVPSPRFFFFKNSRECRESVDLGRCSSSFGVLCCSCSTSWIYMLPIVFHFDGILLTGPSRLPGE